MSNDFIYVLADQYYRQPSMCGRLLQTEEAMPNDTRHLTVVITAKELAELLQGRAFVAMPSPGPDKRIAIDHQSLPRFRSVGGEVSCEIDFRYHVEDVEPETEKLDLPPTGRRKS